MSLCERELNVMSKKKMGENWTKMEIKLWTKEMRAQRLNYGAITEDGIVHPTEQAPFRR